LQDESVSKIDFSIKTWLLKLLRSNANQYEVNTLSLYIVVLFFILGKIGKTVFIDHNASRHYFGLKKRVLLWFLKYSKEVWTVNQELSLFYPKSVRTKIVSPFLPPDTTQLQQILETYPPSVANFIAQSQFLVNSAWKYVPSRESDLYGIETSIELLDHISDLRLLLVLGDGSPNTMPAKLNHNIDRFVESGRLCVMKGQRELWPVFTRKAICLRLTPVDGDSVSIKEALYFKCRVIASDCVVRPKECVTYKYGDFDNLIQKVQAALVEE
jgi:hypothetical protein